MKFLKKLFDFATRVAKSAFKVVGEFIVDSIKHSPAITILVFAAIGLTGVLSMLPIEAVFVGVPVIVETMATTILAIGSVWFVAWMAGRSMEPTY